MATNIEARGARMARIWILVAVTYLVVGIGLGAFMGATHAFQYAPVHAHVNLLGWVTMALAGLIYERYPRAGGSKLGIAHFWLHNLVLPPLMLVLFALYAGHTSLEPVAGALGGAMGLVIVLFAVNLFLNMKKAA